MNRSVYSVFIPFYFFSDILLLDEATSALDTVIYPILIIKQVVSILIYFRNLLQASEAKVQLALETVTIAFYIFMSMMHVLKIFF